MPRKRNSKYFAEMCESLKSFSIFVESNSEYLTIKKRKTMNNSEQMTISENITKARTTLTEQLKREFVEHERNEKRAAAFGRFLETIPGKVKARMDLSYRVHGSYHYANIRPKYKSGFTPNDTMLITAWCASQDKFTFEKKADRSDGSWSHQLSKWSNSWEAHYEILFAGTSEIDGCELIEEEIVEKRKIFRVKC